MKVLICAVATILSMAVATSVFAGGTGKNKNINAGYAADGKLKRNFSHFNKKHHQQNKH